MHDIRYEIIAGRLIMDGVRRGSAQFESRLGEAWQSVYPGTTVPSGEEFLKNLWASTRKMLEESGLWRLRRNDQCYFVRERLVHYHADRLRPHRRPEANVPLVCKAVVNDLKNWDCLIGDGAPDGHVRRTVAEYYPMEQAGGAEMLGDFSPAESQLIRQMYEWVRESWKNSVERKKNRTESASETSVEPRRGRDQDRSREFDNLRRKTLRRVNGQLAVDMLMLLMNRSADEQDDMSTDEDEALELFTRECAGSRVYAECTAEECKDLWWGCNAEDRTLFIRGAITELVDSRFYIIATRCLLRSIADLNADQSGTEAEVMPQAIERLEEFQLDGSSELLEARLSKIFRRNYMVDQSVPQEVRELLRDRRNYIDNAYEMYADQVAAEKDAQEHELERRLSVIRKSDRQQAEKEQRAQGIRQLRKLVDVDQSGFLSRLCLSAGDAARSDEDIADLLYDLKGFMMQLREMELEPFAHENGRANFVAGPEHEEYLNIDGGRLEPGRTYQLVQPGWRWQGEIVVSPKAKPV